MVRYLRKNSRQGPQAPALQPEREAQEVRRNPAWEPPPRRLGSLLASVTAELKPASQQRRSSIGGRKEEELAKGRIRECARASGPGRGRGGA